MAGETGDPVAELKLELYYKAYNALKEIDPDNPALVTAHEQNFIPSEEAISSMQAALRAAEDQREDRVGVLPKTVDPKKEQEENFLGISSPAGDLRWQILASHASVQIQGNNIRERAASYEQAIRYFFGSGNTQAVDVENVGKPDDVVNDTAIEVKYTEDFSSSIYNPNGTFRFTHSAVEGAIGQARRYSTGFSGGVTYFTNSQELATAYTDLFRKNGITNFRFNVVPSARE